jgi:hypothetical protein
VDQTNGIVRTSAIGKEKTIPWSRILLWKLIVAQLVKNSDTFMKSGSS